MMSNSNDTDWIWSNSTWCLKLEVSEDKSFWDADRLSLGIGFLIGLLVGALIAFFCSRLCLRDIAKHKLQDAEAGYAERNGIPIRKKQSIADAQSTPSKKKSRKRKALSRRQGKMEEEPLMPINPIILDEDGEDEVSQSKGLLDALVQQNGVAMETELTDQDLDGVTRLEKELREQNIDTMMQLLRTLLNKQLKGGKLKPEQTQELMKNAQENINEIISTCRAERRDDEDEIRRKTKDPVKQEKELDNINSKYNLRMNSLLQEEKEHFRKDLIKGTDLSDAEIENIMAELAENMANLEQRLGVERLKQAVSLEERLARRRQLAELQNYDTDKQRSEIDVRCEAQGQSLLSLVHDGKLLDRQKEELMNEYQENMRRIQMKSEEELQRQRLGLAEKLRKRREMETKKLDEDQEKQRDKYLKHSDKMTDTADVMESYHELMARQRSEREAAIDELDQEEAESFLILIRAQDKTRADEIAQVDELYERSLKQKAGLSDREAERILALHQQQMEEYNRAKKNERKQMKAKLAEKLQQKRMKSEEEQAKSLAEQQALKEHQDATISKVLASQVELSQDAKQKILKEHEQNMAAINNNLQMSKLRQQKKLEQKLNKRRARVEDLKKQADDLKTYTKKDKEKLQEKLQKQIEDEEQKLVDERKAALTELREKLARETELALEEQERHISQLLARLEVGQARRQALIQKQDKTIEELEDKMANRVAEKSGDDGGASDARVDRMLQTHMNQVASLNDRVQESRERQEQILQEKLQRNKLKKTRELENKLEEEAQEEYGDKQRRGTLGHASSLLSQYMLDMRHRMAMGQLERDMKNEMQKQREELGRELDEEVKRELDNQKKSLLAQLAAVGHLTKDEVNDMVEDAVIETGGDADQAKQLAKEMRIGMKKAKSTMGADDDYGPPLGRRPNNMDERYSYDNNAYDEDDYPPRPKSSRQKRPPSARYSSEY